MRGVKCCRPWEVAIFTQVAAQETCFKPIVLDIHGLPSLVNALECMLADNIDRYAVHWNRVALTLRAMSFSLEQEWVASIIKPRIISSLLRVFRCVALVLTVLGTLLIDTNRSYTIQAQYPREMVLRQVLGRRRHP